MAISRQSDSIWVEGAMGYGEQHSPAKDHDHYGVGRSAHDYGEAMGRQHAHHSIDHYHRDAKGRFAPMPHHEEERERASAKLGREHRDSFAEGYHKGFHSKIKEHEKAEKEKAERGHFSSVIVREGVTIDPHTRQVTLDDPGRFHYVLQHGTDEGYTPPSWLETMMGTGEHGGYEPWEARNPTPRNPYRPELDTIKNLSNKSQFGLNLEMSEKSPFSPNDVGLDAGSEKKNRTYAPLRPGELASKPIQVTDYQGNVHTFVHHISAPNLNPYEDDPEGNGRWVVSLHHHISRPDGSAEWLPSEVTEHVGSDRGVGGKISDKLQKDLWGQLHANSDMVSMYGAGAQRVGDKHMSIEYEFPHPQGDVVYRAKLANGWNKYDGYYFDPSLPERHKERIAPRPQWIVTGRGLERQYPHDPNSPTHMVILEGSDHPSDYTISFDQDDIPGVIDHVWRGLGSSRPSWTRMPQHQLPNRGGKPAADMIRRSSLPPWQPAFNIHRSAERLPAW